MSPPIETHFQKYIKYIGTRPKNDQDNPCREKLCQIIKDVGCFYEFCPEKLYLVYLAKGESLTDFLGQVEEDSSPFIFWNVRDDPKLKYVAFNMDFGPFNLAVTHHFCSRIKVWLDTRQYRDPDKIIVIVLDDDNAEVKLDITLLVAIASMVLLGMTDDEVLERLNFFMMYNGKPGETGKQLIFREKIKFSDVSGNQSLMSITLTDCIKAFHAALQLGFYNYYEFDQVEYLFYETVESGDLNWIVPGKLLAFAGPNYTMGSEPEFYYHYFKDHGVSSIVRLNEPEYSSAVFRKLGFEHHDLIFPDGYPPTSSIASKFIKIVDEAKGAVAVHCFAGIGRTGTLIAAYLMTRYNFTCQMAVAWTRMCRPGSVIGEQQDWLMIKFNQYDAQNKLQNDSYLKPNKSRKLKAKDAASEFSALHDETRQMHKDEEGDEPEKTRTNYAEIEKTHGQAKALVLAKKQRETAEVSNKTHTRSIGKKLTTRTRLERSSLETEDVSLKSSQGTKRVSKNLVLDLGKTVPWALYHEDIMPLQGKNNPDIYRLRDGKYEWKVKFPKSDYVTLRHSYDSDKSDRSLMDSSSPVCAVHLDSFLYEKTDQYPGADMEKKFTKKKIKNKELDRDIDPAKVEASRLRPVVLYCLFSI